MNKTKTNYLIHILSLIGLLYCFFSIDTHAFAEDINESEFFPAKYTELGSGMMDYAGISDLKANNLNNGFMTDKTTHISLDISATNIYLIQVSTEYGFSVIISNVHQGQNFFEIERGLEPGINYTITVHTFTTRFQVATFEVVEHEEVSVTPPKLDVVDSRTVNITGTADAGNIVSVSIGGELYRSLADSENRFSITLEKPFPAGTLIEAYATNLNDNKSEIVYSIVQPANIRPPELDVVDESTTVITGNADSGDNVSVRIGGELYRTVADSNNRFSIALEKSFPAGTGIEAFTTNKFGETSETIYSVVQSTTNFLLGVNRILSVDSVITGQTIPNIRLEADVVSNTKGHIFEGTSDSYGNFSIDLRGYTYKAGTEITVTAFKSNGDTKTQKLIVYPAAPSINSVRWTDLYISGRGEAGAVVYIKIDGNEYSGNVDLAGNFLIPVSGLKIGSLLQAYQISNGIKSDMIEFFIQ